MAGIGPAGTEKGTGRKRDRWKRDKMEKGDITDINLLEISDVPFFSSAPFSSSARES